MDRFPGVRGRALNGLDWVEATGQGQVMQRGAAELITLTPPPGFALLPQRFRSAQRYTAPRPYIVDLPRALIYGTDGMVVTTDGCVLEDLGRLGHHSIDAHPIWTANDVAPHELLAGTTAVIAAPGAHRNISHFLADSMARAQLVMSLGIRIDNWVVSSLALPWQRDCAHRMLPGEARVLAMDTIGPVLAERLIVPARTGFATTTSRWAREALAPQSTASESTVRGRRLLISRNGATGRRLLNEPELFETLKPLGFEKILLESYSFCEQLDLVATADLIVGVHGAAFGHLITAPPGGTLVEIINPAEPHPEYWLLAELSGWNYRPIMGELAARADIQHYSDLRVDPHEVAQVAYFHAVGPADAARVVP